MIAARLRHAWRALVRREEVDAEVREELAAFEGLRADELQREGVAAPEAERRARLELEGRDHVVEAVRDVQLWAWLERVRRDVDFALRSLRHSPTFAVTAVLVIAIGVAAVTAVFSVANTVLFRPMPVHEPQSLAWLIGRPGDRPGTRQLSYPEIERVAADTQVFRGVVAYQDIESTLGRADGPSPAVALIVSSNYFQLLGVRPALGRGFVPQDDRSAGPAEVVLTHRVWSARFGADPAIVGRAVRISGAMFTVVGVAPRGFVGLELESNPDFWVPLSQWRVLFPGRRDGALSNTAEWWLRAAARLQPGRTLREASLRATTAHATFASGDPNLRETTLSVTALRGGIDPPDRGEALTIFGLLLAVPGLVLAIACANVANLLLARASARQRELGIRAALGAGRRRLVAQLVTESAVIAVVGGALGALLAGTGTVALLRMMPVPAELATMVTMDARVLLVSLVVTGCCALIIGPLPALAITRGDLADRLRAGAVQAIPRQRLMQRMISIEVAAAFVLLVVSALFLRSLGTILRMDPGFDPARIAVLELHPSLSGYDPVRRDALMDQLIERTAMLPGVERVSVAEYPPLGRRTSFRQVTIAEREHGAQPLMVGQTESREGLLEVYGLRPLEGRDLTADERRRGDHVAVISRATAHALWPGEVAVGREFHIADDSLRWQVVGVMPDVRFAGLQGSPLPFMVLAERPGVTRAAAQLVVRTRGEADLGIGDVRRLVRDVDPHLAIMNVSTMRGLIYERSDGSRGLSVTLGIFGGVAVLLAAMGLYGVTAYAVTQRQREIGLRLAIGAPPGKVVAQLVKESLRRAGVGLAVGAVLSIGVAIVARSLFFGLESVDVLTLLAAGAVQVSMVVLASYMAARRAARYDPGMVLRAE